MIMNHILQVHHSDNIIVALTNLEKGEEVSLNGEVIQIKERIPQKHKFAKTALSIGDKLVMYGVEVGRLLQDVEAGELISKEKVRHSTKDFGEKAKEYHWQPPDVSRWKDSTFMGYHRSDNQVGVRNYWLVIPMVFCENRNVMMLKDAFLKGLGYAQPDVYLRQVQTLTTAFKSGAGEQELSDITFEAEKKAASSGRVFENVDGIKFLLHEGGCGCTRADSNRLCALLAGYCINPNVAGVTILSLGCQNAQVSILEEEIRKRNPHFDKPFLVFEQQKWSSEYKMLSQAIKETFIGLTKINKLRRQPAPLSKLTIGVKCGGSDGFSGISANPAVGYCADLITALGGKVVLAEFPELCGVEQELIDRSVSKDIGDKFARLMREYAAKAEAGGGDFSMNPSPGNIRDGLITDAIKSAGAARKGGTSPVADVLGYPEYATRSGLNLLCTPGNDVEATTGMAAAGCTIQLFTTGLGTPTGNPVSAMVKISSNTSLSKRMSDIIDLNAGTIITGDETVEEVGERILDYVIELAGGKYDTRAMGLGQDDFIPWKQAISL